MDCWEVVTSVKLKKNAGLLLYERIDYKDDPSINLTLISRFR